MAKSNMLKSAIAVAGVLGGLAFATFPALADGGRDASIMQHATPTDQDGMMGSMSSPEMQQKMLSMMGDCDRMMKSMTQNKG